MRSEPNYSDIAFDIVDLLLRVFHTRRTPDFYYTKQKKITIIFMKIMLEYPLFLKFRLNDVLSNG